MFEPRPLRGRHTRCFATLATALGLAPSIARAQSNPSSVVIWAEGPDADSARAEVTKSLGSDAQVVAPDAWRDAFRRGGPPESIAHALARPKTRAAALERAQRAAASAGVGEVVLLTTSRAKGGHHFADAYLVAPGRDPEILTHVPFGVPAGGLGPTVHDRVLAAHPSEPPAPAPAPLAPGTGDTPHPADTPGAVAASPEAPAADTTPAAASHRERHQYGTELFEVSAGGEVGTRQFSYIDPFTGNLRNYQLGAAPLFVVDGAIYPFADRNVPILSDFGGVVGYAQAFGLHSASDSGSVGTQWYSWYAGGRLRFRTGGARAPVLGVGGAYGAEAFTFDSSDPTGTYPSVSYSFVRASGDVRVPIGRFAVMANGGYLGVLSAGEVASRFPRSSVGGVELGVGGAFEIGSGFEARLEGSYRRFFYAMNPRPGDEFVAGGGLDELWGVDAKVAYVF
jgi:hypothetical protein